MSVDRPPVIEASDADPPPLPDVSPRVDADSVVDAEQELPEASATSNGDSSYTDEPDDVDGDEAISREHPLSRPDSDADEQTDDSGTSQKSQDNDGDVMLAHEQEIEPSTADAKDDDSTPPAADDDPTPPEDSGETTPPVHAEESDTPESKPPDQSNQANESGHQGLISGDDIQQAGGETLAKRSEERIIEQPIGTESRSTRVAGDDISGESSKTQTSDEHHNFEESSEILHHSERDPLRKHGTARDTHPQEWEDTLSKAEQLGVEVVVRSGPMTYQPAPSPGSPGRMVLDPDSSVGALRHEFQHLLDDHAQGWGGMRQMRNAEHAFNMELRAYNREIEYAESIGDQESVEALREMINEERKKWLGR